MTVKIPIAYLSDIEIDQALIEARDNVDEIWTRRAIAGVSVGVPVADAAQAAAELLGALNLICSGRPEGKTKLAAILGRARDDYQRALWYNLAGRGPLTIVSDLGWLVALLDRRSLISRLARKQKCAVVISPTPYPSPEAEAPLGVFARDFRLGDAWEGLALAR
jgi:hypothetical protein